MSCTNDSDEQNDSNLLNYLNNSTFETGAVIACAANDQNEGDILVFYYPEANATNIRLYETNGIDVNNTDFSNYMRLEISPLPFFNGYLEKVVVRPNTEKWIIVTYERDNDIKISNPIRTKQVVKPTVWSSNVEIDQRQSEMPIFSWLDNEFQDNAIYFQVVSDAQDELLSGTYTFENQFQYYNTDNIVLNITEEIPPSLTVGMTYNFTLMDVSEDNWVNQVSVISFIAE